MPREIATQQEELFGSGGDMASQPPPPPITPVGQAEYLASIAWPASLYGSLSTLCGGIDDLRVYRKLLDNYLGEVAPAGPVERMLAEQLFLAHLLGGQLHVKGATASQPEAAKVYLNAAARLMAEFRQSALALKALTAPAATPDSPAERETHPAPARGELVSKRAREPRRNRACA